VCQDKDLKLQCGSSETENNDTRIAIYSSSFSASGGTHIYCPSEGKKDFDSAFDQQACEEQYVTEPVMKLCHGQRKLFYFLLTLPTHFSKYGSVTKPIYKQNHEFETLLCTVRNMKMYEKQSIRKDDRI
jgi:hypothetical protein